MLCGVVCEIVLRCARHYVLRCVTCCVVRGIVWCNPLHCEVCQREHRLSTSVEVQNGYTWIQFTRQDKDRREMCDAHTKNEKRNGTCFEV